MAQGKCSLLKPVDNITGNIFLFSQYSQDLTKQYSNPDSYRCVPSKYIAMNLNWHGLTSAETTQEEFDRKLGNVFQNYFENACAFLRSAYKRNLKEWNPELTRTLLFQALEKYQFIDTENLRQPIEDVSGTTDGSESQVYGNVSGISDNIQYIGDINIYSNNETEDGIGYNEIYCYISNDAQCTDYQLVSVPRDTSSIYTYTLDTITGYDGEVPASGIMYNGLSGLVEPSDLESYIDHRMVDDTMEKCYGIGMFGTDLTYPVLVPSCLVDDVASNDTPRKDEDGELLDKFDANTIVILYDIVRKTDDGDTVLYKNIPLGIYFAGRRVLDGTETELTNTIVKYTNSGQIYNQGTSYGLRVCTRFFNMPNSTEQIEGTAVGSSNISELAPVLEEMGETIIAANNVIKNNDEFYRTINNHLSQFKNNKVNVPYVRQLGNKKYWFVNGKNTGAIAQYEYVDPDHIIQAAIEQALERFYTKREVNDMLSHFVTQTQLSDSLAQFYTKAEVDAEFERLRHELLVRLQNISDDDEDDDTV